MAGRNNYTILTYPVRTQQQRQDQVNDVPNHDVNDRHNASVSNLNNSQIVGRQGSVPMNIHRSQLNYPLDEEQHAFMNSFGSSDENYMKYISSGGDLSPPLERSKVHENFFDSQEDEISIRKYLGVSVQFVSLITENLLSHPFVVLRRQCQVFHASQKYHLHPFSLIPSIIHLQRRQGVTALWKGLGSCLLVRGMSLSIEDILSKCTQWPKDVSVHSSFKRFGEHLVLKCLSIAIVMPFYSASLVETVQSNIASEKPGIFDVFREGSLRLLYWSSPQKGRMLPAWALFGPSVSLGIMKYSFGLLVNNLSARIIRHRLKHIQERKGAKYKDDSLVNQDVEIYSNLVSMLAVEIIFYPMETILHRIQLQGTRTIIDNLDNGYAVVPILTNYQGAIDCYGTTIASEGLAGLYKGFGAIVLQFAAHIAVIKLTKWVVSKISEVVSNKPPPQVMQYYNLSRARRSNSTTISHSLSSNSDIDETNVVNQH